MISLNCCFLLISLSGFVYGQAVTTVPISGEVSELLVLDGQENVTLLCKSKLPISSCIIEIPGESSPLNLTANNADNETYLYYGKGFEKGECGIQLDRVNRSHGGNVSCTMSVNGVDVSGAINLNVAELPRRVKLEERERFVYKVGDEFVATCTVYGGRPEINVRWLLKNTTVTDGLQDLNVLNNDEPDNVQISQEFRKTLLIEDDGAVLTCQAHLVGLKEEKFKSDSYTLNVQYPPKPLSKEELTEAEVILGEDRKIDVLIRAKPKPQVYWKVDNTTLPQEKEYERFLANLLEDTDSAHEYRATLVIKSVMPSDFDRNITLYVKNEHAETPYTIKLMQEKPSSSALIVLISLALVLIAIGVIGAVIIARNLKASSFAF